MPRFKIVAQDLNLILLSSMCQHIKDYRVHFADVLYGCYLVVAVMNQICETYFRNLC